MNTEIKGAQAPFSEAEKHGKNRFETAYETGGKHHFQH